MKNALRLAVLVSGHGSNLRAVHEACAEKKLQSQMVGVFSDKPSCGAVQFAHEQGLHCVAYSPQAFINRAQFEQALFEQVAECNPDLIICAGFMRIISPETVARFAGKMINLHPSLLPKFPGLNTHQRALDAGETEHGASVHLLTAELDAGPVIAASRLRLDNLLETADRLRERVQQLEHPLLIQTIALIENGDIQLQSDAVLYQGTVLATPFDLSAKEL
jgi:phosphoribosylglycinamide formyltransferase 1